MILRFRHKSAIRFEGGFNLETPSGAVEEITHIYTKFACDQLAFIGFNRRAKRGKFVLTDGNNDIIAEVEILVQTFFRPYRLKSNPLAIVELNPSAKCDITGLQFILLSE